MVQGGWTPQDHQPEEPGWWLASDGKWYPPQSRPGSYQPPPAQSPPYGAARPPNYLVQAILTTLFCCLPFGVVSIVYAAQVDSKFSGGDIAGAMNSSEQAKRWAFISFGVGLAVIGVYLIAIIAIAATSGDGSTY